jgi:hypothetical protein
MADGDLLVHAYGLLPAGERRVLPAAGLAGSQVTVEPADDLAIVISQVSRDRFGAEQWERHGEDPAWLGVVAREHHDVLQWLIGQGDVLPLRLPSMYGDVDSLRRTVTGREAELHRALERLHGCIEIAVKAYGAAVEEPAPARRPASGRDYLLRRSAASRARDDARDRRHASVGEIYERLGAASVAAVSNRPQDRALTRRPEPMLLNAAYLVPRDGAAGFMEVVDELTGRHRDEGIVLEASGPWPPYNFAVASEMEPGR